MEPWVVALDAVGSIVLLTALLLGGLVARRRWISHREPTFDMSVRFAGFEGVRGWTLGIGRYRGDRLQWFRVFSLAIRPKRTFDRFRFEVVGSHEPGHPEAYALFLGHVVVDGRIDGEPVQLAVSPAALTALLSWLEAAPPSRRPG
ncbi:MAG: DUF2550 domain-containing protein [Nocardioidaceae bacterium]|nr:DUF2550 domain-containing protein [Nocardioidaceae bacterium]